MANTEPTLCASPIGETGTATIDAILARPLDMTAFLSHTAPDLFSLLHGPGGMDHGLTARGLVRLECTHDRIVFHASCPSAKRHILHALLPIYLGTRIEREEEEAALAQLAPALAPRPMVFALLGDPQVSALLQEKECRIEYVMCGEVERETRHGRCAILHPHPDQVADWLWGTIKYFDFVLVQEEAVGDTPGN